MRSSPPVKYKDKDSPVFFTPFFIVDYISLLGMKRKLFFLNEYCDIDDYKFLSRDKRKNDSLKDMQPEEFYYYLNGVMPLNRQCPIDMDDDIAVLPDIISRKINTLLVVPFQKLPLIAEISTNYGKKLTNI